MRLVVLFLSSVGGRRLPENLADALQDCSTSEVFPPRTVPTENICRCVQQINTNCPATMAFLTTSTITLSCLATAAPQAEFLVTRTREVWWCRYRGHWRSGPRHLSPRSIVCAQKLHCKDIHSHIHSYPPMRTSSRRHPSVGHPSREHPSARRGRPRRVAQMDVLEMESRETEGPSVMA